MQDEINKLEALEKNFYQRLSNSRGYYSSDADAFEERVTALEGMVSEMMDITTDFFKKVQREINNGQ